MPFGIGITELLIVLAILLLIFGPKRIPALSRQLGAGMREFRDGIRKRHEEDDEDEAPKATLAPAATPTTAPAEDKAPLDGEIVRERT